MTTSCNLPPAVACPLCGECLMGLSRDDQGRDGRRGNRPPRRDPGGPALRLYATTEKKGDVADSPFAKLLELKLGGKK